MCNQMIHVHVLGVHVHGAEMNIHISGHVIMINVYFVSLSLR